MSELEAARGKRGARMLWATHNAATDGWNRAGDGHGAGTRSTGLGTGYGSTIDTIWTRCLFKLLKKKENTEGLNPSVFPRRSWLQTDKFCNCLFRLLLGRHVAASQLPRFRKLALPPKPPNSHCRAAAELLSKLLVSDQSEHQPSPAVSGANGCDATDCAENRCGKPIQPASWFFEPERSMKSVRCHAAP